MRTIGLLRPYLFASVTVAVLLFPASLLAQDQGDLDVTMRMVTDEEELSEVLVQELQLPAPAMGAKGDSGARGHERAADMREQGRALGRQISEEARNRREERPLGRPGDELDLPAGPSRDDLGGDRPEPEMDQGPRPELPDQGGRP